VQSLPGGACRLHAWFRLGERPGGEAGQEYPGMAVYTSPTVNDFEELNSWLADQCLAISKKRNHPDNKEHSIYRVFQDEQPSLIPTCVPFNGYSEKECRVSKTGLVGFDRNHYSVSSKVAGRTATVRATADLIQVIKDGEVVGEQHGIWTHITRLIIL